MIVKAFEIKINHVKENKIFLFYGNNQGHKNEIINNLFLNSFQGEIIKIHEDEIVEKTDILLENLMNLSLFDIANIDPLLSTHILKLSRSLSPFFIWKMVSHVHIDDFQIVTLPLWPATILFKAEL